MSDLIKFYISFIVFYLFIPQCSFTPLLMLLLYLSFACVLYFTCLYIVIKEENKDVQSINQSFIPFGVLV